MDSDADWVEDGDVQPRLRARILALKVCRNRCLAHASTDTALEVATPVLKMLSTLLDHAGSYSADATDESVSHVVTRVYIADPFGCRQSQGQVAHAVTGCDISFASVYSRQICDCHQHKFHLASHYCTGRFESSASVCTSNSGVGPVL